MPSLLDRFRVRPEDSSKVWHASPKAGESRTLCGKLKAGFRKTGWTEDYWASYGYSSLYTTCWKCRMKLWARS